MILRESFHSLTLELNKSSAMFRESEMKGHLAKSKNQTTEKPQNRKLLLVISDIDFLSYLLCRPLSCSSELVVECKLRWKQWLSAREVRKSMRPWRLERWFDFRAESYKTWLLSRDPRQQNCSQSNIRGCLALIDSLAVREGSQVSSRLACASTSSNDRLINY